MKYLKREDAVKLTELELKAEQKAVDLTDEILEVLKSFDGKTISKRIDTALKKVDKNLSCSKKMECFPLDIQLFIEDRSFKIDNSWLYLDASTIHIASDYDNKTNIFNFETMKQAIETSKKTRINRIATTKEQLKNIDSLIKENEELIKQVKTFNKKVNPSIAENFDLTKLRVIY